ncbi:hypothetical protein OKA05_28555 [Luteolibacter arcticus]|uniref:Uncharacterized protein n=1 Tax=Luteolibacter arcticus TaxID=1581411 RepID=A0ABT3GSP8_9BACT|nr:hypothetical protein [Luteolibacter arcticus]MCW1926537.1 hypothetical protein [Luteolibacter arcticus]
MNSKQPATVPVPQPAHAREKEPEQEKESNPEPEPSRLVPLSLLRRMLASCRHGLSPRVAWSENRPRMDHEAMQVRGEMLGEIEAQLEGLLSRS